MDAKAIFVDRTRSRTATPFRICFIPGFHGAVILPHAQDRLPILRRRLVWIGKDLGEKIEFVYADVSLEAGDYSDRRQSAIKSQRSIWRVTSSPPSNRFFSESEIDQIEAITADLHIRYLEPVSCAGAIDIIARLTGQRRQIYELSAELRVGGQVKARAIAKFMRHKPLIKQSGPATSRSVPVHCLT